MNEKQDIIAWLNETEKQYLAGIERLNADLDGVKARERELSALLQAYQNIHRHIKEQIAREASIITDEKTDSQS